MKFPRRAQARAKFLCERIASYWPDPGEPHPSRQLYRFRRAGGDALLRLDYPLDAESIVWDAGAFHGDWTAAIARKFGCNITAFEPVSSFAEHLAARFAGDQAIDIRSYGLSGSTRVDQIFIAGDASSSVLPSVGEAESVRLVDIVEVLTASDSSRIDLLKLNVEGAEYEILERLIASGAVSSFRFIQVQCHRHVPLAKTRWRAIATQLGPTHRLMWRYPWVWESWERKPDLCE